MRASRALLYWGTFLIAAGAVMVLANLRGIDDQLVSDVLHLWPLAIVALGVGVLLRGSRLSWAGGMLAAAIPGVALGGVLVVGPQFATVCDDGQPVAMAHDQGTFVGPASVDIRLRCGDVSVTTGSGDGWQLDSGNAGGTAAIVVATSNRLSVASESNRWLGFHRGHDVWDLTLPAAIPVDLALEVNAGSGRVGLAGARVGDLGLLVNAADAHVDLTGAAVDRLSTNVNAGSLSIRLPDGADIAGSLTVNAGSLMVCAPSGLGLQIHSSATLASATYAGLARNGDTWESPDYATAAHRAELTVAVNLGSVQFNPMGGCK